MAEGEAGGDIGLAVLELAVDTKAALVGLEEFQSLVAERGAAAGAAWARKFREAAEAALGRGIDDIPLPGATGPRRPRGSPGPATGGSSSATTALGPLLRAREDQKRLYSESLQQTELLDDIRAGLKRPAGAAPQPAASGRERITRTRDGAVAAPRPDPRQQALVLETIKQLNQTRAEFERLKRSRPRTAEGRANRIEQIGAFGQQVSSLERQIEQLAASVGDTPRIQPRPQREGVLRTERLQPQPRTPEQRRFAAERLAPPRPATPRPAPPPAAVRARNGVPRFRAVQEALAFDLGSDASLKRLENYAARIRQLRGEIKAGSPEAKLLNDRLNELGPRIEAARFVGQQTVAGRGRGAARERVDALQLAQDRRARISDRINELESRGVNVSRLRSGRGGLGQVTDVLSARQFGTFNQQARVLERQLTVSENRLRVETRSLREQERAKRAAERNAPKLPIQGTATTPGSPRALRVESAALSRAARQGGARESITALSDAQQKRYRLEQQIRSLEVQGVSTERLRAQLGEVTTAQARRKFGTFRQLSDELSFQLVKERDQLRLERERTTIERRVETQRLRDKREAERNAPKLPVQGSVQIPGSPRFVQQQTRRQEQIEAALERLRDRQLTQVRKIEEFRQRGVTTSDLERKNEQLTTAITERRVAAATKLSRELKTLTAEREPLTPARRAAEREALSLPVRGSKTLEQSPAFLQEQARRAAVQRSTAQGVDKQLFDQQRAIRRLEEDGLDLTQEKSQLQRAQNQLAVGELEAARATSNELARQLTLRKDNVAEAQRSTTRRNRVQTNETRLTNLRTSELQISEQVNRLRSTTVPGLGRVDTSGIDEYLTRFRQAVSRGDLGLAKKLKAETVEALTGLQTQLGEARRNPSRFSVPQDRQRTTRPPVVGAQPPVPLRFTPEPRPNLLQRGRNLLGNQQLQGALSSGLIGGGFPLLFGQGVGASAGGLIGGLGGGALGGGFGFGLSIVGTLIGSTIDQLTQRFGQLAEALQDPIASLETLIQNATLASSAQERYVQALVSAGRTVEAAEIVREEAGRTIDPAAAALLADAQGRYNRAISDASDILGSFVAGPASEFLNFITDLVRTAGFRPSERPQSLTGPQAFQRARLEQQNGAGLAGTGAGLVGLGLALTPISGPLGLGIAAAGLGVGAFGAGGVLSGKRREQVALSPEVKAAEGSLLVTEQRQLKTQEGLTRARREGREFLAESLEISQQLQAVTTRQGQRDLEAAANFAQGDPKDPENLSRFAKARALNQSTARLEAEQIVAAQAASAANAQRELESIQRLVGLSGERLQIEQSRIAIEQAGRRRDETNQGLRDAQVALDEGRGSQDEVDAARNRADAAERQYAATRLQELDAIRKAEATNAAQRLQNAARLQDLQAETAFARLGPDLQQGPAREAFNALRNFRSAQVASADVQLRLGADPSNQQLQSEAANAAETVRRASFEARNNLIQAAKAAAESVLNISRSLQDLELAQSEARGGNSGVNAFLSGQALLSRQRAEFERLRPQFLRVREQLAQRESDPSVRQAIRNINPSGDVASVNRTIIDFIRAANDEIRRDEDIAAAETQLRIAETQQQLVQSLVDSSGVNSALATQVESLGNAVAELTSKNWQVNVFVPGGSASGDVVRAVNSLV